MKTIQLIESVLRKQFATQIELVTVHQRDSGAQGMSGNELFYYDVTFDTDGVSHQTTLVTKLMPLHERRALLRLADQGAPVPLSACDDLTSESALVCMQHLDLHVTTDSHAKEIAHALATIHVANLGKGEALDWLPRVDEHFIQDFIIDACWRVCWDSLMAGGEFIDGYGNRHGKAKERGDFSAEFTSYTAQLEAAAAEFAAHMQALWQAGDTLTLIHGDLHSDHTFSDGKQVSFIDWGQARYGSFYLDLPNLFDRDNVYHYRDALAHLGHDIPIDQFLINFNAARAYVGFKYFGIGLWNWCFGEPPHDKASALHFINMLV